MEELLLENNDIGMVQCRKLMGVTQGFRGVTKFKRLKLLSLRGNPLEGNVTDDDRVRILDCIQKSNLEDFPFNDRFGGQDNWNGIYRQYTSVLCKNQVRNMVTEVGYGYEYARNRIPAGLWAEILHRAFSMGSRRSRTLGSIDMYSGRKVIRDRMYMASCKRSIQSDRKWVIMMLLGEQMADAKVLIGGNAEAVDGGQPDEDRSRKKQLY